jgi:hypothetical protein
VNWLTSGLPKQRNFYPSRPPQLGLHRTALETSPILASRLTPRRVDIREIRYGCETGFIKGYISPDEIPFRPIGLVGIDIPNFYSLKYVVPHTSVGEFN